ncbi:ABATE domain-containing protein [Streptomyces lunaelactis]|uniref:CGNR zinc finger domain-containing protein n=1 Tax=Streptomyces lunaelactis TaxID=1535768 RepID=UPI001585973A|nr:ABATE domain-containing protein [Streptomyces lunaelactis]NUK11634.1 ABATE domain-containing protein [Streptomyces lunaelactis]NUK60937.1 ABATE domain-containing protein [Streptomyces lunaelactis]NUK72832.1 ABATE domain-containing protein [Streptomyces lunaelactis]NUK82004.1 ABATE domain-containing protein [Streptomyces lunaelactis]NUL13664.1 ABATE domain-containing protein [Streptomyces lunaelactis]
MTAGMGSYDWRFDSGRICLDLVATSGSAPDAGEPLAEAGRLGQWLVGAGLVPAGTPLPAVDGQWAARFIELRDCLGRLVRAEIDELYAEPALERVNVLAAGPPPGIRAVRTDDGSLVRALSAAPECAALLAAIARDAVELLTDPVARARLRQCEGDNCRRVYLDTSRGRRRRWCSSEVCGNRERVARHRRRAAVARA